MLPNFIQLSEIKIKDAEMKKSCQYELAGVDTRVCTCVLRACFPNTAVSLSPPSAAFPLSTGTRGTHPPPTPQRWIEGFPSFCQSYNLSISSPQMTRLHQSVPSKMWMCANKGQSTVRWFWLWPPKPPSCPHLLGCPEVSRNGQSM